MSERTEHDIEIKDLPPGEALTPEEKERLAGAGRFRPTFEALEARQMMDATPTGALVSPPSGGQAGHVQTLETNSTMGISSGEAFQASTTGQTSTTGAILSGARLSGLNLSGTPIEGWVGTWMSGADLRGTILTGAHLDQADLTGANLSNANAINATLTVNDDIGYASVSGLKVYGATIDTLTRDAFRSSYGEDGTLGYVDTTSQS